MNEYFSLIFAIVSVVANWYCYRWGRADGKFEGYEEGHTKGLLEGSGVAVAPSLAGGPGAVPR